MKTQRVHRDGRTLKNKCSAKSKSLLSNAWFEGWNSPRPCDNHVYRTALSYVKFGGYLDDGLLYSTKKRQKVDY